MEELILGELTERKIGYGIVQPGESTIGGVPVIKVNNIISGLKSIQDLDTTHPENDQKYRKTRLNGGEIIISVVGTIGKTAIVPMDFKGCNLVRATALIDIKDPILSRWVKYYIDSPKGQSYINGNLNTTVQPTLNIKSLVEMPIPFYGREYAEKVVAILSKIDDKIENNRKINDNLEQQASSLLSDWISTYPCRTYKLSDIGKYVSDKCDTGDLTSQNYISTENMLPNKKGIVGASNIPTGKVTCFKVDDILIANIRPYFQKIWKADISGGCSTDVLCIRSCVESHSPILYWILHQDAFFEYVMTGAKGCKMPRGDKQHIMNWTIDLPEPEYWADIATQLGAVDQRLAYNRVESINLSNLRDTLLPKLMSGELELNEIDC